MSPAMIVMLRVRTAKATPRKSSVIVIIANPTIKNKVVVLIIFL
jgi:hypothetical protein